MEREKATCSIVMLCRVTPASGYPVSCSGFHAWRKRQPSPRAREEAALTERIRTTHEQSRE